MIIMKHQGKTFGVVWFLGWMYFAALLGGGLFAHIIAVCCGLVVAVAIDRIIRTYEAEVNRKKRSSS